MRSAYVVPAISRDRQFGAPSTAQCSKLLKFVSKNSIILIYIDASYVEVLYYFYIQDLACSKYSFVFFNIDTHIILQMKNINLRVYSKSSYGLTKNETTFILILI